MKKLFSAALAGLTVAAVFTVLAAGSATAKPPGITEVGKKVANFNIILHPNSWDQSDTNCQNSGSRIFYSSAVSPWNLTWYYDSLTNGFRIADCNGTQDGTANVYQNNGANVAIFIRLVGPNKDTNSLQLTCTQLVFTTANTQECLVGTVPLSKNKSFTRISQHLFDTENSSVLWQMVPGTDFKIAQVDVYELLS
jgi:hypothetical protein